VLKEEGADIAKKVKNLMDKFVEVVIEMTTLPGFIDTYVL